MVHPPVDSRDAPGQGRVTDVEACRDCYKYRRLPEDVQESLKQKRQAVSARHPKWERYHGPLSTNNERIQPTQTVVRHDGRRLR